MLDGETELFEKAFDGQIERGFHGRSGERISVGSLARIGLALAGHLIGPYGTGYAAGGTLSGALE